MPSGGGLNHISSLQREAQAQQIQQSMAPPPMRMTTFASNANNFYTPDVNAMTAFQRQMFLPQNAQGGEIGGLANGDNGLTADQEHAAWRAANPGEGPWSGNFAGRAEEAKQMELQKAAQEAAIRQLYGNQNRQRE